MHKTVEEQRQHGVDAQNAGDDGDDEADDQFGHEFGVANGAVLHARRQGAQGGQLFNGGLELPQTEVTQFNFKGDVAGAVVAFDDRWAAGIFQPRHFAQRHGAARTGHGQAGEFVQIAAQLFVQTHDDGHLTVGQTELGQCVVVIARGGDAQRVGNGGRAHAERGGAGKVGMDGDFRTQQAGVRGNVADALDGEQFAVDLLRGAGEQFGVVAGKHEFVFFARDAQTNADLHAGQLHQRGADVFFDDRLRRAFAARVHAHRDGGAARVVFGLFQRVAAAGTAADGGVGAAHMFHLHDALTGFFGDGAGLRKVGAGRQFQDDLRLRLVVGRHEAGRQQRQQGERGGEKHERQQQGEKAVAQAQVHQMQIGVHPARLGQRHFRAQGVGGHHRREQTGDDQTGEDSQRRRPAKLVEKAPDHAIHESGGQKDGNQREGGGGHCQTDFRGRFHGGFPGRFALPLVADDVFDFDDGVIDQNADHLRDGQQGDGVDGEIQPVHGGKGGNDGQRQRRGGNDGGAKIAQKQPDHQHRQQRALVEQLHSAKVFLMRGGDEIGGLMNVQAGMAGGQFLHRFAHGLPRGDFVGILAARHFKTDHRASVVEGD